MIYGFLIMNRSECGVGERLCFIVDLVFVSCECMQLILKSSPHPPINWLRCSVLFEFIMHARDLSKCVWIQLRWWGNTTTSCSDLKTDIFYIKSISPTTKIIHDIIIKLIKLYNLLIKDNITYILEHIQRKGLKLFSE